MDQSQAVFWASRGVLTHPQVRVPGGLFFHRDSFFFSPPSFCYLFLEEVFRGGLTRCVLAPQPLKSIFFLVGDISALLNSLRFSVQRLTLFPPGASLEDFAGSRMFWFLLEGIPLFPPLLSYHRCSNRKVVFALLFHVGGTALHHVTGSLFKRYSFTIPFYVLKSEGAVPSILVALSWRVPSLLLIKSYPTFVSGSGHGPRFALLPRDVAFLSSPSRYALH